jgi:hypothetical protein
MSIVRARRDGRPIASELPVGEAIRSPHVHRPDISLEGTNPAAVAPHSVPVATGGTAVLGFGPAPRRSEEPRTRVEEKETQ